MPSLFRFLFVVGGLGALIYGGLFILATQFEPEQETVSKTVPGIKIKR
jgi:putative flippase GtrA